MYRIPSFAVQTKTRQPHVAPSPTFRETASGNIFLELPLNSQRETDRFYFGDRPMKWVTIQPASTSSGLSPDLCCCARRQNRYR